MEKARGRTLGAGRIDRAKVEATTEDDTRRHMVEDGLDPDNPLAGFSPISRVAEVRRKVEMSQDAFAQALRVPVKTIRNWEQGRSRPDPAARALLAIVDDDPKRAFAAIGRRITSIAAYDSKSAAFYPKVQQGAVQESQEVKDAVDAAMRTTAETLDRALKGT